MTDQDEIDVGHLNLDAVGSARRPSPQNDALFSMRWQAAQTNFQREYIKALTQRVGTRRGWINHSAALAGMDRSGLVKALKRLDLYRIEET